ncbi:hypothetical protein V1389_04475 [Flavobacterium rakeshii]|uniref:hypothetical protein n=1 Tax=Flavobacterium rakeshii TaxID=1038845 RepID=UPI002E7B4521|nr:hypothetical protein [Flavobacterium rakeshii]MEE1897577.1 hypothetical protein [Flavobacterium rakeshii]
MQQPKQPFLETLYKTRTIGQIVLYNERRDIPRGEKAAALDFLKSEYERESTNYPYLVPDFDDEAALWGAKTLYYAAQLYLYRKDNTSQLTTILPAYPKEPDAPALLSADLCLRFLPQVVAMLKATDPEDLLIPVLNKHLEKFHYSVIGFEANPNSFNFSILNTNQCLKQLYLDRIIERKDIAFAENEEVKQWLNECLGDHKKIFWEQLTI